ncbi:MAG TPA: SCP2 sterol-binding domain-containing protein [Kofleriaceae bacterium]|nr:SCP2 sterol-binding domain-containing protein [Kofleriaceae bacterium]
MPATLGRLTDELLSTGVHIEVTGEPPAQFRITAGGQIDAAGPEGTAVRIRGSADRIAALLGGRKHPAAVFVEGGIQVAGDVRQITALSEELPALAMERRPAGSNAASNGRSGR